MLLRKRIFYGILATAFSILLVSCPGSADLAEGGTFTHDDTTYVIDSVELWDTGANVSEGSHSWSLYVISGDLSLMDVTGSGDYLYFDINTPSENEIAYSYSMQPDREAGSITNASLYTGVSAGFGYENQYIIETGTASIEVEGENFTINGNFQVYDAYGGGEITVTFSGTVRREE